MKNNYPPAAQPTLYFIGVTTRQSSIMRLFPKWADFLNLGDCTIQGIDFKLHDNPEAYRKCVQFIKIDPLSRGALITTHKIDLLAASCDLFDVLDPHAQETKEISCISKQNGQLIGHAKDLITSRLALKHILPDQYWKRLGGDVLCLGSGGAATAITSCLMSNPPEDRPDKIIMTDLNQTRLDAVSRVHTALGSKIPVEYHLTSQPKNNDDIVACLKPHSVVINATGLGKDRPGSPLTNQVKFPENGIVWELNYRGDLIFLQQANSQKKENKLQIHDGWIYFIHGWAEVIAEVFHIDIPTQGPTFEQLSAMARSIR